jgi:hypothetical protein
MPAGRPSEYTEETAEQAQKLCLMGATDMELADFFEVSVRTIHRWKNSHEEFCHALKVGKEIADDRVERSMYQKAVGYAFVEQQAFRVKVPEGGEKVEVVDVERHAPADTTAGIFWLKNRRKDDWRDKVDHELTGKGGGPIETADATALEVARRVAFILASGTQTMKDEADG